MRGNGQAISHTESRRTRREVWLNRVGSHGQASSRRGTDFVQAHSGFSAPPRLRAQFPDAPPTGSELLQNLWSGGSGIDESYLDAFERAALAACAQRAGATGFVAGGVGAAMRLTASMRLDSPSCHLYPVPKSIGGDGGAVR